MSGKTEAAAENFQDKPSFALSQSTARTTTCGDSDTGGISSPPSRDEDETAFLQVFKSTISQDQFVDASEVAHVHTLALPTEVEGDINRTSSSEPTYNAPLNNGFGYTETNVFAPNPIVRQRSLPRRQPGSARKGGVSRYSTMPNHLTVPASPTPPEGASSYVVPGARGGADIVMEGELELHGKSFSVTNMSTDCKPEDAEGEDGETESCLAQTQPPEELPWWKRWLCYSPVPPLPPSEVAGCKLE